MVADSVVIAAVYVHLIATVIWMGGIFTFLTVIIPAVQKSLDPPTAGKLMGPLSKKTKMIGYGSRFPQLPRRSGRRLRS